MRDLTHEAGQVRRRWSELGLPGMIDVHTHFMPDQVLRKVWAYFDAAGPMLGREWPITYRDDEQTRIETLRAFGLRGFTSLNYPHKPGMAAWLNDWSTAFAAQVPDCIHSATFYPEPDAPTYVAAALDAGARIFKVHVQVGEFDPADAPLDPVWAMIAERGTPVVIHAGSGPAPGTHTGPQNVERVLRRHPQLALVIAHMGMPEYSEFLDLAQRYENVHLDTTMAFTDFSETDAPFPRGELPRLQQLGDKVVFGSDFPNIPYPYADAIDALIRLDLGDDWMRAVLHDNAARLLEV